MSGEARIRRAGRRDREALVGLWLDLVLHHKRLDPDYPSLPGIRETLLAEIDRGLHVRGCRIFVAEAGERPVGFLFAELDSTAPGSGPAGPSWIHELYVEPDWRRRGVARALVGAATGFFGEQGRPRFAVRVESANQEGLRFWRELGMVEKAHVLEKRL